MIQNQANLRRENMKKSKESLLCGNKTKMDRIKHVTVNANQVLLIKENINQDYIAEDEHFPEGICVTIRLYLTKKLGQASQISKPTMPNHQDIILSKTTRQQDNCNCYICQTGRYKGHNKNPRNVPIIISVENGLYGSYLILLNQCC